MGYDREHDQGILDYEDGVNAGVLREARISAMALVEHWWAEHVFEDHPATCIDAGGKEALIRLVAEMLSGLGNGS